MNILVPAIPKRLAISPTMMDDFVWDPVLGFKFFFGYELDIFQRVRLKYYWHVPFGIDSSGFTSGKTITDWGYVQLRCLLMPEHEAGVYYTDFQTMKDTFWPYYTKCKNKIFQAHLGQLDDKGEEDGEAKARGASAYVAHYRNGSLVRCPAPSHMKGGKTQASRRYNTMLFEEWTHVDEMSDSINMQLLQRNTKPAFFNQHHPLWTNHAKFTAPAKTQHHPGYERVEKFEKIIRKGNPTYFHIHFCYKDYSPNVLMPDGRSFKDGCRVESTIALARSQHPPEEWLGEGLGIWGRVGKGWYAEADMLRAIDLGALKGVRPLGSRADDPEGGENVFYFGGVDPAPAQSSRNDDGAIALLRAKPMMDEKSFSDNPADYQLSVPYLRRLRNADAGQWAAALHDLHRRFSLSKLLMDWGAGGGGPFVKKELAKATAKINNIETAVTPIVETGDAVVRGHYILHTFRRRDPGIERLWGTMAGDDVLIDNAHTELRQATMNSLILFPKKYPEWTQEELLKLGEENIWTLRNLTPSKTYGNNAIEQFCNIAVAMKEGGKDGEPEKFDLTSNGARRFSAVKGRKDLVYAILFAYIAFLIWLRMAGYMRRNKRDSVGFGGF